LRPRLNNLKRLAVRVKDELLPRLTEQTEALSRVDLHSLSDRELANVIKERLAAVKEWQRIYYDEFIPLAHGVRQLGLYYNNAVKPEDPYEFMGLLEGQDLLASKRNRALESLAEIVAGGESLRDALESFIGDSSVDWIKASKRIQSVPNGSDFLAHFERLENDLGGVSYKGKSLAAHPEFYIHTILELAEAGSRGKQSKELSPTSGTHVDDLERKLYEAVGENRHREATEIIELGRLSWKLRDDDNILVGRLESLLLDVLDLAGKRLIERGLLNQYERLSDKTSLILADALLYPPDEPIAIPQQARRKKSSQRSKMKPRQLVGQPAGPGIATGRARLVRGSEDLRDFKYGSVLICDAIQPTMTHIVPLASAIVERRGGMLIHGAIIARELGIPCVNGVADAVELIEDGELVTVDGHLGIVTVGKPEFDLEFEVANVDRSDSQER
jgi:pyruvate,water dikinase